MPHVITASCCKDGSCVSVCPVDCIRPAQEGTSGRTSMLFIDPDVCIDCGACMTECPVGAIHPEEQLPASQTRFRGWSADYFKSHPLQSDYGYSTPRHPDVAPGDLRVAIVGAGPSGCYAATELLRSHGVEVTMVEKLPTPYGLVRAGVAPDHQDTKAVTDLFDRAFQSDRFTGHLNVEVGVDLTHEDLVSSHHAVIYAAGARVSRNLGIPGDGLDGSVAAADFVGWYNGHPDHTDQTFDFTGHTVAVIGNGNVALDVARVLLGDLRALATTDIADHALIDLAGSSVREVVVIARRGPRAAAFSVGEFLALQSLPGVDVVIDSDDLADEASDTVEVRWKLQLAREFAAAGPTGASKRIVFKFDCDPVRIIGTDRVTGIELSTPRGHQVLDASMVMRSIGFTGEPIAGLPFDARAGVMLNSDGRVVDNVGRPIPGTYVTGWLKRGSNGVIGTNRSCAEETVARLWKDYDAGTLNDNVADARALSETLAARGVRSIDWDGWQRIDAAERGRGERANRPRRKITTRRELIDTAIGTEFNH